MHGIDQGNDMIDGRLRQNAMPQVKYVPRPSR
jgi:hypothetical protein